MTHVHTHVCTHACTHVCARACAHVYTQIGAHVGAHAWTRVCTYVHVRMSTYKCLCTRCRRAGARGRCAHACRYTCLCTCLRTCICIKRCTCYAHADTRAYAHAFGARIGTHPYLCTSFGACLQTSIRACVFFGSHVCAHAHTHAHTLTPTAPCSWPALTTTPKLPRPSTYAGSGYPTPGVFLAARDTCVSEVS